MQGPSYSRSVLILVPHLPREKDLCISNPVIAPKNRKLLYRGSTYASSTVGCLPAQRTIDSKRTQTRVAVESSRVILLVVRSLVPEREGNCRRSYNKNLVLV